jgi:hypothetical protein
MVCSKKPLPKLAALNKDLQKGIEKQIFGFVQGHISHQKFTKAIFSVKSTTSLKFMY